MIIDVLGKPPPRLIGSKFPKFHLDSCNKDLENELSRLSEMRVLLRVCGISYLCYEIAWRSVLYYYAGRYVWCVLGSRVV